MQLELAQIPLVDGTVDVNLARVVDVIANRREGTDLVVFPETTLTGFPTRDNVADVAEPLDGPSLCAVRDAARKADVGVVVGFSERDAGRFYNTTVLIDQHGEVALRYRKTHLWASDVGVYEPGDTITVCEFKGMSVGILICYDIEFPETARAVALLGADLLIVTNGNMAPFGPVHRRAITARAMENQMFAALVNRIGDGDEGLWFTGESALVSPFGEVLCEAPATESVLLANIDKNLLAACREHYTYLRDARIGLSMSGVRGHHGLRYLEIRPPLSDSPGS